MVTNCVEVKSPFAVMSSVMLMLLFASRVVPLLMVRKSKPMVPDPEMVEVPPPLNTVVPVPFARVPSTVTSPATLTITPCVRVPPEGTSRLAKFFVPVPVIVQVAVMKLTVDVAAAENVAPAEISKSSRRLMVVPAACVSVPVTTSRSKNVVAPVPEMDPLLVEQVPAVKLMLPSFSSAPLNPQETAPLNAAPVSTDTLLNVLVPVPRRFVVPPNSTVPPPLLKVLVPVLISKFASTRTVVAGKVTVEPANKSNPENVSVPLLVITLVVPPKVAVPPVAPSDPLTVRFSLTWKLDDGAKDPVTIRFRKVGATAPVKVEDGPEKVKFAPAVVVNAEFDTKFPSSSMLFAAAAKVPDVVVRSPLIVTADARLTVCPPWMVRLLSTNGPAGISTPVVIAAVVLLYSTSYEPAAVTALVSVPTRRSMMPPSDTVSVPECVSVPA